MGKPYSIDLRERVVATVKTGGLSCRQAKQFGVGISTAINWVRRLRETGSVAPARMGGHRPKLISGKHRLWLLQRIKEGEFTLRGLVAELAERGLKVDYRTVWNFVHAEKPASKKAWWLANATDPTSRGGERSGQGIKIASSLSAWSSSTRPGPGPTWPRYGGGRRAAVGLLPRCRTAAGKP